MDKLNKIKIGEYVFISALAHDLNFEDGTKLVSNPKFANDVFRAEEITDWEESHKTKARKYQSVFDKEEDPVVQFKKPRYEASDDGKKWLQEHILDKPDKQVIVTSIIGAKAFKKGTVAPVTTPETSRKPPNEKIVFKHKWHAY